MAHLDEHGHDHPAPAAESTFLDAILARAARHPDRRAYTFLADGEDELETLSYGELDRRARSIAAHLQEHVEPGERALLLHPAGLDFVTAFLGCLYAGVIAVPGALRFGRTERVLSRLETIATDATPRLVLTVGSARADIEAELSGSVRTLAEDELADDRSDRWRRPAVTPETTALLQYTSGSTSTPKGVVVTHRNLVHNEQSLARAFGDRTSVFVNWLPHFHDMGLVWGVLQPLWVGAHAVQMAPEAFLRRPGRWLKAISRYGGQASGGPNFAYDLCVQRVKQAERDELDLRTWHTAFNGAEPVLPGTLERFAEAFAPCGFRRKTLAPGYGLAESTLFVTVRALGSEPAVREFDAAELARHRAVPAHGGSGSRLLVGSGGPQAGTEIAIVDPETGRRCAPGHVGEIWLRSDSVASGYWQRPEESEAVFRARLTDTGEGPFLRTGDLGFVDDGELFVAGRIKDVIVVRGENHYPQDVEQTVERCDPALRRGGFGAAFSVEVDGLERLVVVQEVERGYEPERFDEVAAAVRRSVAEEHGIPLHAFALVRRGTVPKTSSGKIARSACRQLFVEGRLRTLGAWSLPGGAMASAGAER